MDVEMVDKQKKSEYEAELTALSRSLPGNIINACDTPYLVHTSKGISINMRRLPLKRSPGWHRRKTYLLGEYKRFLILM